MHTYRITSTTSVMTNIRPDENSTPFIVIEAGQGILGFKSHLIHRYDNTSDKAVANDLNDSSFTRLFVIFFQ
jgi:hypothetical protein